MTRSITHIMAVGAVGAGFLVLSMGVASGPSRSPPSVPAALDQRPL